jgi:hypothetical protein
VAARCRKGCGCFLESRNKELLCGVGGHACRWHNLVDTTKNSTAHDSRFCSGDTCTAHCRGGARRSTWHLVF